MSFVIIILAVGLCILFLLRSKKAPKGNTPLDESAFSNNFEIGYKSVHSKNGTFTVNFRDGNRDASKRSTGFVVLTCDNKVQYRNSIERPYSCSVSNDGVVVVCDWLITNELKGHFVILDRTGNQVFKRITSANVGHCSISDDSKFAIFETHHSETDDSDKIFVIDVSTKKEIHSFPRPFAFIEASIDSDHKQITLANNSTLEYIVDFTGKHLNEEQLKERILKEGTLLDMLNFFESNYSSEELFKTTHYKSVLLQSLTDKEVLYSYGQDKLHRKIGELFLSEDNKEKAIEHWEKALALNPKIGVKKKLEALRGEVK